MSHVRVTRQNYDSQGNAGMTESLGSYATVEEAKANALGAAGVDFRTLWWKEFSATTWGLMSGQKHTDILVSDNSRHHADA